MTQHRGIVRPFSRGHIILVALILFDVYLFFTKTATSARLLAAGSFLILTPILVISLYHSFKAHGKNNK